MDDSIIDMLRKSHQSLMVDYIASFLNYLDLQSFLDVHRAIGAEVYIRNLLRAASRNTDKRCVKLYCKQIQEPLEKRVDYALLKAANTIQRLRGDSEYIYWHDYKLQYEKEDRKKSSFIGEIMCRSPETVGCTECTMYKETFGYASKELIHYVHHGITFQGTLMVAGPSFLESFWMKVTLPVNITKDFTKEKLTKFFKEQMGPDFDECQEVDLEDSKTTKFVKSDRAKLRELKRDADQVWKLLNQLQKVHMNDEWEALKCVTESTRTAHALASATGDSTLMEVLHQDDDSDSTDDYESNCALSKQSRKGLAMAKAINKRKMRQH